MQLAARIIVGLVFAIFIPKISAQSEDEYVSPCPEIFSYTRSDDGHFVAYLSVTLPKQRVNTLRVQFSLLSESQQDHGRLRLTQDDTTVIDSVMRAQPVYYLLEFPQWDDLSPRITEVHVNDALLCAGEGVGVHPGKTTRTIVQMTTFTIQGLDEYQMNNRDGQYEVETLRPPSTTKRPNHTTTIKPTIKTTTKTTTQRTTTTVTKQQDAHWSQACGLTREVNTLAVGGKVTPKGKYPWLAPMYAFKSSGGWQYQCVGNLVTDRHAITAGHCTEDSETGRRIRPDQLVFALGSYDLDLFPNDAGATIVYADRVQVPNGYSYGQGDADLALVTLQQRVSFTVYVRPICLWPTKFGTDADALANVKGAVTGWGLDESDQVSRLPREVHLPIVSQSQCLQSNPNFKDITSNRTFCAGNRDGIGPCNGDSGSAFSMFDGTRWYIRGVVSVSLKSSTSGSCDLSNYIVFADLSKFSNWINKIIENVR